MKTWLCVVLIQCVTKSYHYEHHCRVRATSPASAAGRAMREALAVLRPQLKGRRLHSLHVNLTNLGPVQVGSKLDPVHHDEARM